MQTGSVATSSPPPEDTPPLSYSPSPSASSANRSSAASSSSNIGAGLAELSLRMSKMHLEGALSDHSIEGAAQIPLRKIEGDSISLGSMREDSIKEEECNSDGDQVNGKTESGRFGYQQDLDRSHIIPRQRPAMIPRQSSYSKRHSSFDTPREVPYPHGFLAQSLPGPSGNLSHERTSSLPSSSQQAQRDLQTFKESQGKTSVGGAMQEESPSPPASDRPLSISSQQSPSSPPSSFERYSGPGVALSPPGPKNTKQSIDYSPTGQDILVPSVARTGISIPPSFIAEPTGKPPSPPILMEEAEDAETGPYRYIPPMTDSNARFSLPPPLPKLSSIYSPQPTIVRPASLPHSSSNGYHSSLVAPPPVPPPEPPTILTPPPNAQDPSRKPAPHEPFLSREQSAPNNAFIAVQTLPAEYTLLVRLPGFQRDSMYVHSFYLKCLLTLC